MSCANCWRSGKKQLRVLLDFESHDDGVSHLTEEDRREISVGLAEIQRGEIASEEEV